MLTFVRNKATRRGLFLTISGLFLRIQDEFCQKKKKKIAGEQFQKETQNTNKQPNTTQNNPIK